MKTSHSSPLAFTLVELLTVIAIIAILMGLLFPVIGAVKDKARGVEATNMMKQLVTAITQYNAEYGKFPVADNPNVTTDTGDFFGSNDLATKNMLEALRVPSTTSPSANVTTYNPRLISYIDLPSAKIPAPAKATSGLDSDGLLRDPWGGAKGFYRFRVDNNYNNQLQNPYTRDTGAGPDILTKGVIVWCLGKSGDGGESSSGNGDKTSSTAGRNNSDDITSW